MLDRRHHQLAILLCVVLLAIGCLLRRSYGIAWDEPTQRGYGQTVARFVLKGDTRLQNDPLRVYGPAHELLLTAAETLSHARDTPDVYAVRHFVNFVVFVVGVYFLYRVAVIGLGPSVVALLPSIALVLSPAIFGHAFFNSKDIPFLAAFITSAYTLLRFLERPGVRTGLVHAIVTAWLLAIRAPGLLMPVLTVAGVAFCLRPSGPGRPKLLRGLVAHAVALPLLTVAFWPTLWHEPWSSFRNAVATMSHFPWSQHVLYRGAFLSAADLPWHYAPVWIAITTPLLYLAAFVAGLPVVIKRAWSSFRAPAAASSFYPILILAWLFVPLVSVVVFRSTLYDGWRQLFFVYPALLLFGTAGVVAAARALRARPEWRWSRAVAIGSVAIAVVAVGDVAMFMVRAHPNAHVFFNTLAGGISGAKFRYEMDYWGLSTRQGLEAILRRDRDPIIPVFAADPTGETNALALPFVDRHRLLFVESLEGAKYFVGSYRLRQTEYSYGAVVDHVDVSGVPILTVEAVHPEISLTPDTAPSVVDLRVRNAALLRDADLSFSGEQIRAGVRAWLGRYVRAADEIDIDLPSPLPAEVREGRVPFVGIRIHGGEVGDFQFNRPGIPVTTFDVRAEDLLIDFARLSGGELPVARIGTVTINDISLDARAVNEALARSAGQERNLRVSFDQGLLTADWRGSPATTVSIRPAVVPDPWRPASENLAFDIDRVKLSGWRVPLASLAQLLLGGFSPAIGPADAITTRVALGRIRLDGDHLRLGTQVR